MRFGWHLLMSANALFDQIGRRPQLCGSDRAEDMRVLQAARIIAEPSLQVGAAPSIQYG